MKLSKLLAASAAAIALSAGYAGSALAQAVTSTVRGVVTSPTGAPVPGAVVTVTDSRTGATRTVRTGANGQFSVSNLEVGGPYTVTVDSAEFRDERVEDLFVSLSDTAVLSFELDELSSAASGDEIVVVASRSVQTDVAIGPNSVFSEVELTNLPSIGRDIRDVIRLDPRVTIDPTNGDAVSCVGSNNRFNSFTVDGVPNNDTFGLNASGFVNRNGMPIPFDAIRETSVEFAPFDVEYGQFTGCNINVVTKSGTNEFHGSAFATMNTRGLTGGSLQGTPVASPPFHDFNWGATFGGPVIEDKLFFFVAYEEYTKNRPQSTGPVNGGFANTMNFVTVDQANAIASALDARGIPTLGITSILPSKSRRILTRWDWNINDNHRLAFTYQRLREFVTLADDLSTTNNIFALGSNFYRQGTNSESYSARLFSNWSDNFSTELRASRADIGDIQDPVGGGEAQDGNPIPRVLVGVTNDFNGNGTIEATERGAVLAGPGFSRAANLLTTQLDQIKAKATWTPGSHTISFGYELNQLDAYNIFAQNATGTLVFGDLAALNAGTLKDGTSTTMSGATITAIGGAASTRSTGATINGVFSGDIDDAAAIFSRSIHTLYVQDSMQWADNFTALIGLRYDFFVSGDRPLFNQKFTDRYGFDNQQGYQGLHSVLPRLGFNWDAGETLGGETTFRLGTGVFSGGDPTVWFSNIFSNPGTTLSGPNASISDAITAGTCTAADRNLGAVGDVMVPNCLVTYAQNLALASDGRVDAVDPDFKAPTVIRSNFGFTHNFDFGGDGFFDNWTLQADAIYSRGRNSVDFVDVALHQFATAVDGRPVWRYVDPLRAGCDAVRNGVRGGWTNVNPATCFTGTAPQGARDSIVLTNALEGTESFIVSAQLSKDFEFDSWLFGNEAGLDVSFGYAHTSSDEAMPATSSVSTSNFRNIATDNIDNFALETSNYQYRHSANAALSYREKFLGDLWSKFSVYFSARSGQPYSLSFRNGNAFGENASTQRALLYIPTGPTDPNVVFGPGFDQTSFFAFLAQIGADKYAGGIAPRNAFESGWFLDMDFRFQQDLPRFLGLSPQFYVDIENLPNLINDEANIQRQVPFPYAANIVVLGAADPGTADFQYNQFVRAGANQTINTDASLWRAQLGLRFEF